MAMPSWRPTRFEFAMSAQQLLAHYVNSANACTQRHDYASALQFAQLAVAIAPAIPEGWYQLAQAEAGLGNRTKSLKALEQARVHAMQSADAQNSIGLRLLELDALAEAESCFLRALALQSGHAMARSNLGQLKQLQGRPVEAEEHFRLALQQHPELPFLGVNLGSALHEQERYEEAETVLRQALDQDPNLPQGWKNLAVVLTSQKRDAEAITCYEQMIRLSPADPEARWGLALLQIKARDYPRAWDNFEYRWQVRDLNLKPLRSTRPLWLGQQIDGSLLLWGEQGLGDQILFGSILPETVSSAKHTIVALDKRLIPLFKRSMAGLEFVDLAKVDDTLQFREQLPFGSLPRYFRKSDQSFAAARHPYLSADRDRVAELRQKIDRPGKLVCGISWHSSRKQLGRHKSMPLEQLVTPFDPDRFHFVNLQYGNTETERQALAAAYGTEVQSLSEIDCFNDIDGLAALIDACDVVLTISNSTAHLAGALGKTTLLLLPWSEGRLWYWANHEGRNPWYPSVEMFAQENPGDWDSPLRALKIRLEQFRQLNGK